MKTDWTFNWLTLNVNFSENYYSSSSAFTFNYQLHHTTSNIIVLHHQTTTHQTTSPTSHYHGTELYSDLASAPLSWFQKDDACCSVMQRDAERCRQHSKENLAIIQWCWAQVAPSALWRTTTLLIIMSGDPEKKQPNTVKGSKAHK